METMWQFWIDVGGTFTDCVARRPDGMLLRHKVLSSGVMKGRVGAGSTPERIVDYSRIGEPAGIWNGNTFRLLSRSGSVIAESQVAQFDSAMGALYLTDPLPDVPAIDSIFELSSGDEAPIVAMRFLLGLSSGDSFPAVSVRLGTTRGTNALLTRTGARTAFVTTRGFGDILHIGYQNRPRLFDLAIKKSTPLFSHVVEIDERVTWDGVTLRPLQIDAARKQLAAIRDDGAQSLAICLMNAYAQPRHEQQLAAIARELGFAEVSVSHEVAPVIKLVARGDTTVIDAYLNPVLRSYVERLQQKMTAASNSYGDVSSFRMLTSAGGLVHAGNFTGKDSILSGPAGGVVGFSRVAVAAGFSRAIGFDMGGTSTDVSRFDGRYELEYETQKAGVRVVTPMLAIETVAAGGGSICTFDGVKLVVGPESAGAEPGPACYGRGGPLTVTDVNLVLGRVLAEHFPFPLDHDAVIERLREIAAQLQTHCNQTWSLFELADGFRRIANANMANAIRTVSIAKGYDPRDYVLVAFGGAAAQHACAVAAELGMTRVLSHPDAGVLSAVGIGLADVTRHRAAGVYQIHRPELFESLRQQFADLVFAAVNELVDEGVAREQVEVHRFCDVRYRGLDSALTIPWSAHDDRLAFEQLPSGYAAEHQRLYGYVQPGRELEVVTLRVEAVGRAEFTPPVSKRCDAFTPEPWKTVQVYHQGEMLNAALFQRDAIRPGARIEGPAIIVEPHSTTIVDPGWTAEMLSAGELVLSFQEETHSSARDENKAKVLEVASPDPVLLEIFNHQFAAIAEQMGITLRQTSTSVNVKERLDFSCAIFTSVGDLVVNAPHIPVHLGAMGETVKAIIADNPSMRPGDVYLTNDPFRGGSHLPDVTVVTPIHDSQSGRLLFFTASRAHHAEIGGITPGSMPPFSKNLEEEGVLIRNFRLLTIGESHWEALRKCLTTATFPSRDPETNLQDIAAQVAANRQGERDLLRLVERYGVATVEAYMRHIQRAAEAKTRAALARLTPGVRHFIDHLDDGTPINVTIKVHGAEANGGIEIDFTGTGSVSPTNLNANRAIVTAAVMYVMRCLIAEDIPLNQGVLTPVKLILPHGLLNPPDTDGDRAPRELPAIVGGNVETSQRVVDVLLGALQLAAASQGTMNNLLFGNGSFGYYETICGGSGATADSAGANAVHTHMTNTRLTDPEILERRFPVRLQEFSVRRGSGGKGKFCGGDGVIRRIEFLQDLQVSIVSQRRGPFSPYGLCGGEAGQLGHNRLQRKDSSLVEELPARVQLQVSPGDVLEIQTPGGGGFHSPK